MPGEWLMVPEAAELTGYNSEYLRQLIRLGDKCPFKVKKTGRFYFIERDSLTTYVERQQNRDDVPTAGPQSKDSLDTPEINS
ncbi:MAG: hypothetical protein JXB47_09500 [Anaerolineae bacterium]|nr:hypothetical protein [Anaerolineae bacterium]